MKDLAAKLRELAAHMREVAVELDYYGGFAPWAQHANELLGAAGICDNWAKECSEGTEESGNAMDIDPSWARID